MYKGQSNFWFNHHRHTFFSPQKHMHSCMHTLHTIKSITKKKMVETRWYRIVKKKKTEKIADNLHKEKQIKCLEERKKYFLNRGQSTNFVWRRSEIRVKNIFIPLGSHSNPPSKLINCYIKKNCVINEKS